MKLLAGELRQEFNVYRKRLRCLLALPEVKRTNFPADHMELLTEFALLTTRFL